MKRTLIVMAHGINPVHGSLFKTDKSQLYTTDKLFVDNYKCNDASGNGHLWKTHGMAQFLEKDVTGTFNHTYAQGFSAANESPTILKDDLANRNWSIDRDCEGQRFEKALDAEGKIVNVVLDVSGTRNMKSFFEQATMRWFEGEILKFRSAAGNPDAQFNQWVADFRAANPNDADGLPSLAETRRDRTALVPGRFIVIVHSMGGLVTREYIHSNYYSGDIDKVVTLDSPMQGSYAVDVNDAIIKAGGIDKYMKFGVQTVGQALQGTLMLAYGDRIIGEDAANFVGALMLWTAGASALAEIGGKVGVAMTLAKGYGFQDGANQYLSPGSDFLLNINSLTRTGSLNHPSPYPFPAFRVFHHEGLISPNDPRQLAANSYIAGFLVPKVYQGAAVGLFESFTTDYISTDVQQQASNIFLSTILGAGPQLNFTQQGTIVVNAKSSRGGDVAMYNQPDTDIRRHLFSIKGSVFDVYPIHEQLANLPLVLIRADLTEKLAFKGLDAAAKWPNMAWVKWLKGPVGSLITSTVTSTLINAGIDQLPNAPGKQTIRDATWSRYLDASVIDVVATSHDYATINSHKVVATEPGGLLRTVPNPAGGAARVLAPTLLEDFLYEAPYASLDFTRTGNEIYPGLLDGANAPLMHFSETKLKPIVYSAIDWKDRMALREETHEQVQSTSSTVRRTTRWLIPNELVITAPIEKFRFRIDDLRPDLMEQFSFTTHYGSFGITWDRIADPAHADHGKYNVWRWTSLGKEFLRTEPSPISDRGEWLFEPKKYLKGNELIEVHVFRDGQNPINLAMTNHAGMTTSQRFHIMFQATEPLITMIWPTPFAVVSIPQPELRVLVNCLSYPGIVINRAESYYKIYPRTEQGDDNGAGVAMQRFDFLESVPENAEDKLLREPLPTGTLSAEGKYWLEINVASANAVVSAGASKRRIPFIYDGSSPTFSFQLPTSAVNPDKQPLNLSYSYADPPLQSLQVMRARIVDADDGTLVYEAPPTASISSGGGSMIWKGLDAQGQVVADGLYSLQLSGKDQSAPDATGLGLQETVLGLASVQPDGAVTPAFITAWNAMTAHPGFRMGSGSASFYLDRGLPGFTVDSFFPTVSEDQVFSLSYRIADGSAALTNQRAKVRWIFEGQDLQSGPDVSTTVEQTPVFTGRTLPDAATLTLSEEQDGLRLRDGRYSFSAKVTDASGNEGTYESSGWRITVDRTAPRVRGFFSDALVYNSAAMPSAPTLYFQVDEDEDALVNRMDPTSLEAGISVAVTPPGGVSRTLTATALGGVKYSATLPADLGTLSGEWVASVQATDSRANQRRATLSFFVNVRPPLITYPSGSAVSGRIGVIGIAPPISPTSAGFSYYELTWRKAGEIPWQTAGIQIPEGRHAQGAPANQSAKAQYETGLLGYWDVAALTAGLYEIRVRVVDQAGNEREHIEDAQVAPFVGNAFTATLSGLPTAPFTPGSRELRIGVGIDPGNPDLGLESELTATQAYTVRITVSDAGGAVLKEATVTPLTTSVFLGTPSVVDQPGIYLWNEGKTWTLKAHQSPGQYKFSVAYSGQGPLVNQCGSPMRCSDIAVTPYDVEMPGTGKYQVNRILEFTLAAGQSAVTTFQLPSTASFLAQKEMANGTENDAFLQAGYFFTGRYKKRPFVGLSPDPALTEQVPLLTLQPIASAYTLVLDGFRPNGSYPQPGTATVRVEVENEKTRQVRSVTGSFAIGQSAIAVTAVADPPVLRLEPGSPFSNIAFKYGLFGGPAFLTAYIRDPLHPATPIVRFFADKQHQDKKDPKAYAVQWKGLNSLNQLVDDIPNLEFVLEARLSQGGPVERSLTVPFAVEMTKWVKAPAGEMQLRVLETDLQDATYVMAKPEFRVAGSVRGKAGVSQPFNYGVEYTGEQNVLAYPSKRYNFFMRRHRDEFYVTVVAKLSTELRGYREIGGVIGNCDDATTGNYHFFRSQSVLVKRGAPLELPLEFGAYGSNSRNYVFRCIASGCATDIRHSLSYFVLPGGVAIPDVYSSKFGPQQYVNLSTQHIFKEENIQLFDNKVIHPGPGFDPTTQKWSATPAGAKTFSSMHFQTNNLPIAGRSLDQARCPAFNLDSPIGDPRDKNSNGIMDAKELCTDNTAFDPNSNLFNTGINFANGKSSWTYAQTGGGLSCTAKGYFNLGLNLKLTVPEEYWDAPFGYNNMANANFRFDPNNQFMAGFFRVDGYDNNGDRISDDGLSVGPAEAAILSPFARQSFRYTPHVEVPNASRYPLDAGGLPVKYTTDHDKGVVSKNNPLVFPMGDNSFVTKERWDFGFNGGTELGGSSMFTATVSTAQCSNTHGVCPETAPRTVLAEFNSVQHRWPPAEAQKIKDFIGAPANYAQMPQTTPKNFRNLFVDIRLKVKPEEMFQSPLIAQTPIAFPAGSDEINAGNTQYGQDAGNPRKIHAGVSGVRFGRLDGFDFVGSVPKHLLAVNHAMGFVDVNGFFVNDLDPEKLPVGARPVKDGKFEFTGTLADDGSGSLAFVDLVHFRKNTLNLLRWPAEQFSTNIKASTVTVSTPTTVTATPVMVGSEHAIRFTGGTLRDWSSIEDGYLIDRDMDGDASQDEDVAGDFADLDGDGAIDEDSPGDVQATLEFPLDAREKEVFLKGDLYVSSAVGGGTPGLSLYNPQGLGWQHNTQISNVSLQGLSVRHLDGSLHADLELDLPNASPPVLDPESFSFRVKKNGNTGRAKEFITLAGLAPGKYSLHFLTPSGGLSPVYPQPLRAPAPGAERVLGYLDISRLQGPTSLLLTREASDGSIRYQKLDIKVGTKVAPGAAHTVSSLYGNSEVFFPDGAVAGETPVTVRVTNAAESGLSPKNNLSAIGPVIEVLPSITFPSGTRPQIKISLTRHEIGSVDPADLRIHKPDGDNLVELDFHVYNFFQGETPVCGTDNPTGICNEAWDKLVLAATTSSFSHFVVLDRTNREVRTFEVAIEPAKSMLRQRELAVTGLPRGAFFLSTDDDPVFNETGDPTPAIQADFSSILDEGSDYVRGLINLTDARITYIFVSPNAANGKVKSVEAELIPSVSFRYSGASLLRIGGGNSTAEIAYSSNQDGVLVLELESADRRIVSTPIPVANTWGMDFIVSWEAIHGGSPVPDGRYKTHLTLEAGNGQPVRIQGPDIVVDYQAPLATLRGAVIKEAGSTLVRLSGRITDADGFTDSDISLHFGPEPLRLGLPVVMNGDLFEMEILLDDAALANCNGCRLSAELFSYDKAFNTARAVWSSDPVMVLSRRTFRIQGGIVPGKIVDFMVPVSVDGGTDWFDFESTQPDGSDVYFQDDLGSRMLHETEFFDKAGKKGLFWVTVPFIKASKPTAFFMNWSLPGSGGDPVPRPQYTPFASIWRFTGGNPGADYSGNAVDAIISGSGYDAGLQGNGLALSGPVAAAEAGHGPVLACSSQVSASMWVKFGTAADLPAVLAPIFRKGTGTGEDWSLRLSRDKLAVAVENHLLEVPFNGIATGSWTHIAFSFTSSNGGRTRIYVNGREIASGTLNGGNNIVSGATGLVLGGGAFHGIVDEVHLSRETLSPDWFLLEYEAHKPFNRVVHPDQERLNTPLFVRSVGINTSASGLNLAQDLVDFPVKVELKQSLIPDFPHMQPDNIAFADEFGALLPFDVETWQPDQDRAVVWVRLPKLPAGRTDFKFFLVHDQRFRLVLNHAPATWSPSFQGVWHMSSANQGMDAAAGQGGTVTAGKAQPGISGHSLSLTGPGQRMEAPSFPNGLNLRPGFTLEGWYSIESASLISGNQGRILSKASAVGGEQFGLGILPTGNTLSLKVQGSTLDAPANTLAYGGWHQVLATVSATGESKLFHDGQQVAVGNFGLGGNLTWNGNPLLVGRTQDPASSQGFMGLLDEVRVQSSLRDPSWVAANYLNQSLGNASLQFGDEEIFTESIFRIPPAPSVEVRMKEAAVVGVKASRPSLQIVNDSENHLSGLTMRLWLSREENPGVELALDPYVSQPCGIRYSVRQHPENGNLLMVDLVFPEDFILPPGESTPIDGIQLGLHFRNPHSQTWNRDNDPSWAGNASSYVTTDKVTLYNRLGELIYGQEPDPASIPAPLNPAPVAGTRVDRAVQALYFHHEGSGNRASDRSSAGIPLDLLISGTGTAWIPTGGLEFTAANHGSILQNRTPNTKLFSSSTVSGEVTLEAWISTSNFTHDFARILAYTPGDGQLSRNWDLVQTGRNIEFRLRTSSSESVSLATTGNPLAQAGTRYQITATYKPYTTSTGQGGMRIYVNGVQVAANTQAGVIQASGTNAWNSGYVFAAGNKPGPADKGWQGVLHLTAIYSAALTAAEVQQNHSVGVVEPALPPMALVGVQCGDRLLPVLAGDGISPWNEDKNPLGASLQMNGVTYPKGIGARTAAGGKTSFLVYPIEDERLRLGLSGKAVRLTGFTGLQQGASVGGTQFKISRSDRMPSDQEWISNSGSVEALMTSNNGANVPVDLDVSGAKWLFLGMSSTAAQPDVSGVFGELQVRFGGDAPAIDPPAFLPGLAYRYHEGTWDHLPDFSAMIPLQEGITTGFSLAPRLRDENFAFEFSGHLRITAVGTYTFFTSSDDGSRLFIDGQQVVDNDGLHGDQEASGSLQLSPGMHAIKVTYFERSGSEVLAVRYQGPGISKILIPTSELFRPGPGMFSGAERSEAGLKALYLFRREAGETVYDLAPSGLPQDLELSGDGTDWLQGGGVGFNPGDHNSLLMNVAPNAKIAQAAIQTGMLSVETWIEASDVNLNEFRRIMELASRIGNGDRNFAVSQKGKNLEFALRTSGGANVSLLTSGNPLQFQSGRYHVVMTYRRSGLGPDAGMRIYVNGILAAQNTEAGVLSATGSNPWNNDYVLSVGNRPGTLDRDWGGGIFLAAIYDHALTPDQIRTHYQAGIPSRTSTEVIPVGVTRWERLLPLDAVDGMSLWQEDRSASGNPISMGGIGFRTGISGQPQANGAAVWMLYDLEKERQELGLSGIPLRLTGYAGRQDGSGSVNIKIKTSKSVSEPPAADWLSGSAGTQERFSASDATNVALDVDLYGAKWLWLEQSAQGQANPGQGVFGQIKAHFGRDPALSFVPKVEYRYFEIPASALPDFDALIPVSTGFIGQFDLSPRLRNDNFAFEFRGLIQIHASGTYTFYTSSDDGSRLFIDGKLIVDNDGMHGMQERSGTVALDPGHHTIKVQYFDCTGSEALTVDIQGPGLAKQAVPAGMLFHSEGFRSGIKAKEFLGQWSALPDFASLTPAGESLRNRFQINPRTRGDDFGFDFQGHFYAPSQGSYTFYISSDDGSRLYIDGNLLVDNDGLHGMQERSGSAVLEKGFHPIRVAYFERSGSEGLEVRFQGPNLPKALIPSEMLFVRTYPTPCIGTQCGTGSAILMGGENLDRNYALNGSQWFRIPLAQYANQSAHTVMVALDDMDGRPMEGTFRFEGRADQNLNAYFQSFPTAYTGQAELFFTIEAPVSRSYKVRWWFQ